MNNKNRKTLKLACVLGIIISWTLLILGSCALRDIGGETVNALTNGLLIGNGILSTIVYGKTLKK